MAINKKFVHFKTFANFTKELEAGNILDASIVFIKDKKWIYTHKTLYKGNGVLETDYDTVLAGIASGALPEVGDELQAAIAKLHKNKVDKAAGKSLVADEQITKLTALKSQAEINGDLETLEGKMLKSVEASGNGYVGASFSAKSENKQSLTVTPNVAPFTKEAIGDTELADAKTFKAAVNAVDTKVDNLQAKVAWATID